jgi:hypothetical protein
MRLSCGAFIKLFSIQKMGCLIIPEGKATRIELKASKLLRSILRIYAVHLHTSLAHHLLITYYTLYMYICLPYYLAHLSRTERGVTTPYLSYLLGGRATGESANAFSPFGLRVPPFWGYLITLASF